MKTKRLIPILLIAILVFGCKTVKQTVKQGVSTEKLSELIQKVQEQQPKFNTANVNKMNLSLNVDGRTFNVAANCKIRTDSAMHISIMPAFGFELFKLEITPDSIFAFDKINKKLYAINFEYIEEKFGLNISFRDLQSVISNQLFNICSQEINAKNFTLSTTDKNLSRLSTECKAIKQSADVNSQYRIERIQLLPKSSDYQMTVDYSQFTNLDMVNFPLIINIEAKNLKHNLNCDFNISKATFNNNVVFSSLDASKYTRGDIKQLMNK